MYLTLTHNWYHKKGSFHASLTGGTALSTVYPTMQGKQPRSV